MEARSGAQIAMATLVRDIKHWQRGLNGASFLNFVSRYNILPLANLLNALHKHNTNIIVLTINVITTLVMQFMIVERSYH